MRLAARGQIASGKKTQKANKQKKNIEDGVS